MKKKLTNEQINEILKILEEAIDEGPWDQSNFLKAIGNKLRAIRAKFLEHSKNITPEKQRTDYLREKIHRLRADQQEVFITVYSSDGSKLSSWEHILSNLPKQVISRPVYVKEEDAIFLIRSKENRVNEAYVSAFIKSTDILPLPEDKIAKDRFDKPLLTLKDRALTLENIHRFVHLSGNYTYVKGRLVLK